jgi:nucleotide-binding universal stress UspA family protein
LVATAGICVLDPIEYGGRPRQRSEKEDDMTAITAQRRGPVLACVDDGAGSGALARVAGTLASRMGAGLLLTTVQPAGVVGGAGGAGHSPELVRRGRSLLASAARELDQPAELRVMFGEPAERLIALAQRERAELIVISGPAAGDAPPPRLGNAHIALAGAGPCPVLVVPRDADPGSPSRASA